MSELVTGDAVVLGLRTARLPSRALALVIDLVLVWTVYLVGSIALLAATASLDDAARAAITVAMFLLVLVGAPIAVETLSHGRSLGKLACGLRVVRDDGGPIRFRHALVRGAIGVVEVLMTFGIVACVASLVSARGRRVGDVFAGTLVLRERVSAGRVSSVPPPPPWLVGRFTQLDLSAVPDGLWLAVRQYLTRIGHLDAAVGRAMAERLAGDLAGCTGVQVPQGVPPAAYLAAVVNERQAREARRVFGDVAASGAGFVPGTVGPWAGPDRPTAPVGPGGAFGPVGSMAPIAAGPVGSMTPVPDAGTPAAGAAGAPSVPVTPVPGSGRDRARSRPADTPPAATGFVPPA